MKQFLGALILLLLIGCNREDELRLNHSQRALDLLPELGSGGWRFSNAAGDTVVLRVAFEEGSSQRVESDAESGPFGEFDVAILQRSRFILADEAGQYEIHYDLQSSLEDRTDLIGTDLLRVHGRANGRALDDTLELEIRDSVLCASPSCSYSDSLSLGTDRIYTRVYYTGRTTRKSRLYINENNGLIGFTTDQSVTFERIP